METDLLLDPFGARWADVRDAARAAADAGFAGIWTWDHLDGRVHREAHVLECWTTLTAIASAIPDVRVGPLVLNVANRHPAMLATMAATLQEVSGGRLLLGLGAGGGAATPYPSEQRAVGRSVPADPERRAQVEACVAEVRRLWSTAGFVRPEPAPPFVIGGFGPKMAELAGRVGDGFNTQAFHPQLERLIAVAREAHTVAGQDSSQVLVTAFAGLEERWLRSDSAERRKLLALDVDRLILIDRPPYDRARIGEGARLLAETT